MRKAILILGTLLIATILISGSAMAPTYIIKVDSYNNCTNPNNAVGSPDGSYATIGVSGPPPAYGWIILDFGVNTPMEPSQDFTVYGTNGSGETETYDVEVIDQYSTAWYVGSGDDITDNDFTTPSMSGYRYRFVKITGTSGSTGGDDGDVIYGPEIDAVGY